MSMEVERRERGVDISAYERFTERERALIHKTVAPNTTPEELLMFLSLCQNYNLDPFNREAWCIKIPGRNGGEGKLVMIVGKYGWLKVVDRNPDYRGTVSQVVHEGDEFRYLPQPWKRPDGQWSHVEHGFDVTGERGRLLGAYSEVYREGRPPEFFYAKLDQYQPFSTVRRFDDQDEQDLFGITVYLSKRDLFSPWLSQTDSMILKCAQTTAWRNAFALGAIYGEEEMSSAVHPADEGVVVEEEPEWGEDPEVAERIQSLVAAANNAKPGSYPPAKVRLMLAGLSDDERYALIARELIPFVRNSGGVVPEPGEHVVADEDMEIVGQEGEPVMREPAGESRSSVDDSLPGV